MVGSLSEVVNLDCILHSFLLFFPSPVSPCLPPSLPFFLPLLSLSSYLSPSSAMAPFYSAMCTEIGYTVDADLLSKMEAENAQELAKLEEGIEDAEKNFGETEQRDALLAKADYLCKIGSKVKREPAIYPYQSHPPCCNTTTSPPSHEGGH